MERKRNTYLIVLFFTAFVLVNPPMITMFSGKRLIYGIPSLYWYVFVVWALIIGAVYWIHRPGKRKAS